MRTLKSSKVILVMAMTLALGLLFLMPAQALLVYKYRAHGDFASVDWGDWDAGYMGVLSVHRGDSNGKPTTFLAYYVYQVRFPYEILEEGYGLIPNEDFKGVWGSKNMTLNTVVSNTPDFTVITGTGGLISLEWKRDYMFPWTTFQLYGSQTQTWGLGGPGTYTVKRVGPTQYGNVKVTGDVLNYTIPNDPNDPNSIFTLGNMGWQNISTLEFERK